MQYLCCYAKALQQSLYQYGLFSARFMFTDLSDIDETTQAKVGAEIWTVKSDKHRIQKEQKARQLYLHNFLSEKPLCVYGDNY